MNEPSPYSSEPVAPEIDRDAALRRVKAPAISLIVVAVLSGLATVVSAVLSFVFEGAGMAEQQAAMLRDAGVGFLASPLITIGSTGLALIASVVMIVGGMKMRALQGYGLAFTAAVLACLPCFTCCCVITLPFGVWAIVVLLDANVKRAFV